MEEPGMLSEAFLAEYRDRLDAIGEWKISDEGEERYIIWENLPVLNCDWVPLRLEFYTIQAHDWEEDYFDPDEQMFELWELFVMSAAWHRSARNVVPLVAEPCEAGA